VNNNSISFLTAKTTLNNPEKRRAFGKSEGRLNSNQTELQTGMDAKAYI